MTAIRLQWNAFVLRAWSRMAERSEMLLRTAVVVATLALVGVPIGPALAAPQSCGGGLSGLVCSGGHGLVEGLKKVPGLGDLIDTANGAYNTVDSLTPENFLDSWAQGLCHAVIFTLTFIESTAEELGKPAFNQQWWQAQYAVSFGLALTFLAFLLPVVTARIGGPEGSVSAVELLRRSGWRMIFVVPACAFAPAFMYAVEQLASALTKSFATSAAVQANGAVGGLLKAIQDEAGNDWADFGGTVMCIVLMLAILIAGVLLVIEMSVANWGVMLCGLLVPLGLVAAVYPPWSHILRRIIGIILGMMFLPAVIFFFFWTVWSAFNANVNGQGGSNSTITMIIYLLVALTMIDAFPLVAVWLLSIVAPGTEQMDQNVRSLAPQPTWGEVYSNVFEKHVNTTWDGGAPQGGGDDDSGNDQGDGFGDGGGDDSGGGFDDQSMPDAGSDGSGGVSDGFSGSDSDDDSEEGADEGATGGEAAEAGPVVA